VGEYSAAVEPFGRYDREVSAAAGLLAGAVAVLAATLLLELSRSLAERYRGRWYAGNGRAVVHVGAAAVLALAFALNGLPGALAFAAAATASMAPLLLLDDLPPRRPARVGALLALFAAGSAPAIAIPRSLLAAANAIARALFP
jgi:hypothetical protein